MNDDVRIGVEVIDLTAYREVNVAVSVGVEERAGVSCLALSCPEICRIPTDEELEVGGVAGVMYQRGQIVLFRVYFVRSVLVKYDEESGVR